jgi:hypothetical protein
MRRKSSRSRHKEKMRGRSAGRRELIRKRRKKARILQEKKSRKKVGIK